jgi:hypothetical protein
MGSEVDKPLTAAQRAAAALEAGGAKTDEIADACGVGTQTIRSWRKNPLYSVALDEFGRKASEDLQPIVNAVRSDLGHALITAIKELVRNVQSPDEKISNEAASIIMRHADLVLGKKSGGGEEGKPAAAAQSVVKVTISPDAVKEGSPFHVEEDVEDAEVVEE